MNLTKAQLAAIRAARAAGDLMRRNWRASKKINSSSRHDIKLELDVRAQNLITKILHSSFPKISLLGEEGLSGDPASSHRWVVDPIDGTVNFAHGIPHACVSIALQSRLPNVSAYRSATKGAVQIASEGTMTRSSPSPRDEGVGRGPGRGAVLYHQTDTSPCKSEFVTVLGVVFDPFSGELWTAIRGQPARLNGKIIHVSRRGTLGESVVSMGFAKSKTTLERTLPYFNRLIRRVRKIRLMGSAALALTYVASGRFDAYIESGIHLWDVAAGGLIIECAGGEFWREPIPGDHAFHMIASNGLLRKKLQSL